MIKYDAHGEVLPRFSTDHTNPLSESCPVDVGLIIEHEVAVSVSVEIENDGCVGACVLEHAQDPRADDLAGAIGEYVKGHCGAESRAYPSQPANVVFYPR